MPLFLREDSRFASVGEARGSEYAAEEGKRSPWVYLIVNGVALRRLVATVALIL